MVLKKASTSRPVRSFVHVGLLAGVVLVISALALAVWVLGRL